MTWLDRLPLNDRRALNDAGRLGNARFELAEALPIHKYDNPAYPQEHDACVSTAQAIIDSLFHEDCGQRWSDHDNAFVGATLPFGCLPELELRRRWGDR